MRRYLFHRLVALLPVLLVVSVVVFCLIHLAPGDPALVILGNDASPQDIAALRQQMGLDRPLLVQFFNWFGEILTGDLGHSLFLNTSVMSLFLQHLTPTLALALYAQLIALILGLAGGGDKRLATWRHHGSYHSYAGDFWHVGSGFFARPRPHLLLCRSAAVVSGGGVSLYQR